MQKFLSDVAEILEVDAVTPEFEFRNIRDWDSMKGFALLVLLENDYGRPMTIETFLSCRTVGDLAKFVGIP